MVQILLWFINFVFLCLVVTFHFTSSWWQALKSGQLPADLKTLDEDTGSDGVNQKDDNMVQDEGDSEPKDGEEQGNDKPAPMEQVWL